MGNTIKQINLLIWLIDIIINVSNSLLQGIKQLFGKNIPGAIQTAIKKKDIMGLREAICNYKNKLAKDDNKKQKTSKTKRSD